MATSCGHLETRPQHKHVTSADEILESVGDESLDESNPDDVIATQKLLQEVVVEVLAETLSNVEYEPQRCRRLSDQLARHSLERINLVQPARANNTTKHVVVVSIGSVADSDQLSNDQQRLRAAAAAAEVSFGTRCLWNTATDHVVSAEFHNSSLFAVALIFTVR